MAAFSLLMKANGEFALSMGTTPLGNFKTKEEGEAAIGRVVKQTIHYYNEKGVELK